MDFQKTISGIFSNLSGNAEQDIKYLNEKMEFYKNDENSTEIIRAIGRKLYEILPEEKKKELGNIIGNHCDSIQSTIDEAMFQLKQNGDCKKAEQLLSSVVKSIFGMFKSDGECVYMSFENPLEHFIYLILNKPEKTIRMPSYNYAEIYYFYGYCLIENKKFNEAEIALKSSLEWNPVSTRTMFELAEIYKMNKDFASYLHWTKETLKYAYGSDEIARCYRNLGYYYSDIEEYSLASSLYYFSQYFKPTDIANSELFYIAQKTGTMPKEVSSTELKKVFADNDIPFGANDDILGIAYSLGKQFEEEENFEWAQFCYNVVFDLTRDDKIKKLMDSIKAKM